MSNLQQMESHCHKFFTCFNHPFTTDNIPQEFAVLTIADPQDHAWHPDNRATDHMTGYLGNLHSLTPYHGTDGVMVGNGETLPITHIGQATIGTGD